MAITINAASAAIDLAAGGAVADVAIGNSIAVFHLTKGFSLADIEAGLQPGPAFTAIGHFGISLAGGNINTLQFGFVQIAKMHSGRAFYAGRINSEGSITVSFQEAMPAPVLLDSLSDRTPFTVAAASRSALNGAEVNCPTADHPALKVPRKLRNSGRNIDNFLFHVTDKREFWSVLTAVDPAGKRQSLAHFHWMVDHNVKFSWRAGNPLPVSKQSAFTVLGNTKGPPTDSDPLALLANPIPPQFNDAADKAMLQAFLGPRGPNRSENDFRFNNVPNDFFT